MIGKAERYVIRMIVLCVLLPVATLLAITMYTYAKDTHVPIRVTSCERCEVLEKQVDNLLSRIYSDDPDYYLDVLSESEEYAELQQTLMEPVSSIKRRPRNIKPDEPSKKPGK